MQPSQPAHTGLHRHDPHQQALPDEPTPLLEQHPFIPKRVQIEPIIRPRRVGLVRRAHALRFDRSGLRHTHP